MTADLYIERVLDQLPRSTPRREQIAAELRGHITERVAAGQPIGTVLAQLGDPVALAESYLAAVPLVSASFGRRAAAKILDIVIVFGAGAIVCVLVATMVPREIIPILLAATLIGTSVIFTVYLIATEAAYGRTLGKRLLGLRVVRESGARIGVGQAIVRALPWFLEVFWIDAMFALFTDRSQRAFELLSKTRVVLADERP